MKYALALALTVILFVIVLMEPDSKGERPTHLRGTEAAREATKASREAKTKKPPQDWDTIRPEVDDAVRAEFPGYSSNSDYLQCVIHRRAAREFCRRRIARTSTMLPEDRWDRREVLRRWAREGSMRDMDVIYLDYREDTKRHSEDP